MLKMNNEELKEKILVLVPKAEFKEGSRYLTAIVPKEKIHSLCKSLKEGEDTAFDYLFCLTAIDYPDRMTVVYHMESTIHRHCLVLKADIPNRENPVIETVSDIWITADYHEREAYDFFGIEFKNHPDLRRLFLDEISDNIGHPMRKDYVDEINIIER
jgi:NADH-quinone oxidoreductase subunit C